MSKPSERKNRRELQMAYAAEVMKEAPCAGCGARKADHVDMWTPDRRTLREHGLDDGRDHNFVIRLCTTCLARGHRDPSFVTTVEDRILAAAAKGVAVRVEKAP